MISDGRGSPKAGVFETYENENDRDKKVTNLKDTSVKETDAAGDKAKGNTRSLEQEQHGTDKGYLDENAGKNIAKGQGSYDMINNRDYGTTLRLAREADAYNNKPVGHMFAMGPWRQGQNIAQDMGTGYDKPKIETMETRAMDQSFNLDTNQKQLAQALQDAVNHKDLDAFQQLYKQLYGIELDKMTAEIEMTKQARIAQFQDSINRRMSEWTAYLNRAINAQTAAAIVYEMGHNEVLGNMMAWMLGNGAQALSQDEVLMRNYQNQMVNEIMRNNPNLNTQDVVNGVNYLINENNLTWNNRYAGQTKKSGKYFGESGRKAGNGYTADDATSLLGL